MYSVPTFLVIFGFFAYSNQILVSCNNCGLGFGKNVCHKTPGGTHLPPLVVRPVKLPKIDLLVNKPKIVCKEIPPLAPLSPLKTVGDLCSCKRTIVTPACVPKPACAVCQPQMNVQTGKMMASSCTHTVNTAKTHSVHTYKETSPLQHAPADPVSLTIAFSQQNKGCNVQEDRLNFGFRKLPQEVQIQKKINKFPEENLFKLNGEIVELRQTKCSGKSLAEEAAEDLIDEELLNDEIIEEVPVRKISYGELGFAPANIKCGKFETVQGHGVVNHPVHSHNEGIVKPCNDGFVSGKVVVESIRTPEVYTPPQTGPLPCDSIEELEKPEPVNIPLSYPAFQYGASQTSHNTHSKTSSCQNTAYFQKM